ncbi:hypothetical protein B0H13DRAFT_2357698 [Mycena leptocephala]|nr:hypothetical protein B0H13DRAFT_2357698 [Mycena leptocephala]
MRFKEFLPLPPRLPPPSLRKGIPVLRLHALGPSRSRPRDFLPGKYIYLTFTVTANLTCAIQLGNTPTFLDYYIDAVATHTVSGPIPTARRTYHDNSTIDQFIAMLPNWFYFTDAPRQYSLMMDNSFARSPIGPDWRERDHCWEDIYGD